MKSHERKDSKGSFQESFSTAISSSARTVSGEIFFGRTVSIKEQENKTVINRALQVIPEYTENDMTPSSQGPEKNSLNSNQCSQRQTFIESQKNSLSSNEDKRPSQLQDVSRKLTQGFKYIQDGDEEHLQIDYPDGYSILRGEFVLGIRDEQHLKEIQKSENSRFLYNLIQNHLHATLLSDIELHQLYSLIPIIVDYYDIPSDSPQVKGYAPFNSLGRHDLLTFKSFSFNVQELEFSGSKTIQYSYSEQDLAQLNKKNFPKQSKKIQGYRRQSFLNDKMLRIKKRSISEYKKKAKDKEKSESEITIKKFNLDPLQQPTMVFDDSSYESSLADREIYNSYLCEVGLVNIYEQDLQNRVVFKDCCKKNTSNCQHKSQIAFITIDNLLHTAFTSPYCYYYVVLLTSFQDLYASHVDFIQEVIKLFFQQKNNLKTLKIILKYIIIWIEFKQLEILMNNDNFISVLQQFTSFASLLFFGKSNKIIKQLNQLNKLMIQLKNQKKNRHEQNLTSRTVTQSGLKKTSVKRHCSMNQKDIINEINSQKQTQRQKLMTASDIFIEVSQKIGHQINNCEITDWQFYLNVPVQILQKQLWLIDVEMIKEIRMSDFSNIKIHFQNPINVVSGLSRIVNHFNMLLYHMMFIILICPKGLLSQLLNKLIHLSSVALQAGHIQLSFLIYSVLNHDIIQSLLDVQRHLSLMSYKELKSLNGFVQNKKNIYFKQGLQLTNNQEQVPCLAWAQSEIFKLHYYGKFFKDIEGIRFVNFVQLELQAQILFPLIQAQQRAFKMKQEDINKHVYQPHYDYFKMQLKYTLQKNLRYESDAKIEIELYKLRNRIRMEEKNQ